RRRDRAFSRCRDSTRGSIAMTRRSIIITVLTFAVIAVTAIVVVLTVRRKPAPTAAAAAVAATAAPAPAPAPGRKIKAQLFYVSDDGLRLVGVERDVPYAEQPVDQAREILNAQITPVAAPLVSAVPAGTVLRALFLTEGGQAYVDLSRDVAT